MSKNFVEVLYFCMLWGIEKRYYSSQFVKYDYCLCRPPCWEPDVTTLVCTLSAWRMSTVPTQPTSMLSSWTSPLNHTDPSKYQKSTGRDAQVQSHRQTHRWFFYSHII